MCPDKSKFYSYWLQRDEIMLDVETCAMAFRILRMNGYNVSAGIPFLVLETKLVVNLLKVYYLF